MGAYIKNTTNITYADNNHEATSLNKFFKSIIFHTTNKIYRQEHHSRRDILKFCLVQPWDTTDFQGFSIQISVISLWQPNWLDQVKINTILNGNVNSVDCLVKGTADIQLHPWILKSMELFMQPCYSHASNNSDIVTLLWYSELGQLLYFTVAIPTQVIGQQWDVDDFTCPLLSGYWKMSSIKSTNIHQ